MSTKRNTCLPLKSTISTSVEPHKDIEGQARYVDAQSSPSQPPGKWPGPRLAALRDGSELDLRCDELSLVRPKPLRIA